MSPRTQFARKRAPREGVDLMVHASGLEVGAIASGNAGAYRPSLLIALGERIRLDQIGGLIDQFELAIELGPTDARL
jgi:hypothetical protein